MANSIHTPEFDRSLFDNVKPQALDVFYDTYPDTPVYFVTKRMGKACPLHYKALICTYTGWWHGLQGWNIDAKDVIEWEQIKGYTVSDFIGKKLRLALTPEQYEKCRDKNTDEIVKIIMNNKIDTLVS